jgi:hypothetical protein
MGGRLYLASLKIGALHQRRTAQKTSNRDGGPGLASKEKRESMIKIKIAETALWITDEGVSDRKRND